MLVTAVAATPRGFGPDKKRLKQMAKELRQLFGRLARCQLSGSPTGVSCFALSVKVFLIIVAGLLFQLFRTLGCYCSGKDHAKLCVACT